jgi:L,D-transpeptidase YcbB
MPLRLIPLLPILLVLLLAAACRTEPEDDPADLQISFFLQRELQSASPPDYLNTDARGAVTVWRLMRKSYEERAFLPLWRNNPNGSEELEALRDAICGAVDQGLNSANYHVRMIDRVYQRATDEELDDVTRAQELARLDLLASHAFLLYGSHLVSGYIDPRWDVEPPGVDLFRLLEEALEEEGVAEVLNGELAPSHISYQRLQQALQRYRGIEAAGGWPEVDEGRRLEDQRQTVIHRLIVEGDLPKIRLAQDKDPSEQYSEEDIDSALRSFQRRHGLADDGVFGPATTAAMNVPVGDRIRQIERNMERWRWLPSEIPGKHVLVNVAGFELLALEGDNTVLTMPIVVGMEYRETPLFDDAISYLEVNPYWHIPRSIAVEDMLPRILENERYLETRGIEVLEGGTAIDPKEVDWDELSEEEFPYRLRQKPGPLNALGEIKFMFPNEYAVYLHDTPDDHLFDERERMHSSGCIRVAKPLELAEWLLEEDAEWSRSRLEQAVEGGETKQILIDDPVPVYLGYWTVWVGDDDRVYFWNDVYGQDEELAKALPRIALASATPAGTRDWCRSFGE